MRLLKAIFDFYLNASVHVALAVIAFMGATLLLLNIPVSWDLFGFTFFGTMVCYNFIKYGVEAEKYLIVSNKYHKYIQIFSFLCFAIALYFFWQLEHRIWISVLILGLLSTLYAIPFLPKAKNLRSLGGLKIYIVALVWVGFTVFLPLQDQGQPIAWDVWVLFLQRFLLVMILMLPFDIRDLERDKKDLKTLPQLLGVSKARKLGVTLTVMVFLLSFLKDGLTAAEILSRLAISILLIGIFLSKNDMRRNYFASFWVEAIPICWFGLLWILNEIF